MLTTDKILAHKTNGKNLILLTQVASSYFLVFGQIVYNWKGNSFKTILQKKLTESEASAIYSQLSGNHTSSNSDTMPSNASKIGETLLLSAQNDTTTEKDVAGIIYLLEAPKQEADTVEVSISYKPVQSPYFPFIEILLTQQKPRAPSYTFTK